MHSKFAPNGACDLTLRLLFIANEIKINWRGHTFYFTCSLAHTYKDVIKLIVRNDAKQFSRSHLFTWRLLSSLMLSTKLIVKIFLNLIFNTFKFTKFDEFSSLSVEMKILFYEEMTQS
jgi:hypothetical protein